VLERLAAVVRARAVPPVELEGSTVQPVLLVDVAAGDWRRVGVGEPAVLGSLELAHALERLLRGALAKALPAEVAAELLSLVLGQLAGLGSRLDVETVPARVREQRLEQLLGPKLR
jgi:hypothetical protein